MFGFCFSSKTCHIVPSLSFPTMRRQDDNRNLKLVRVWGPGTGAPQRPGVLGQKQVKQQEMDGMRSGRRDKERGVSEMEKISKYTEKRKRNRNPHSQRRRLETLEEKKKNH